MRKSNRKHKKYMVKVGRRWVHFGDKRYQQFKDQTKLKAYAKLDHNNKTRRRNFLRRMTSHTSKRMALKSARPHSAKYFAIKYLW